MQTPITCTSSDKIETYGEPCRAGVKVCACDRTAAWDDLEGVRSKLVSWDEIEKDESVLVRVAAWLAVELETKRK